LFGHLELNVGMAQNTWLFPSALYKMASFALQKRLSYTVEQCLLHCKTMAFEAQSDFCRLASELFLQDDFGKTLN